MTYGLETFGLFPQHPFDGGPEPGPVLLDWRRRLPRGIHPRLRLLLRRRTEHCSLGRYSILRSRESNDEFATKEGKLTYNLATEWSISSVA